VYIGIPRETSPLKGMEEKRVALSPDGVRELAELGATIFIEAGAGQGAGFSDLEFERAGAKIVYSREEVFGRADLLLSVERPPREDLELLNTGSTMIAFHHMAIAPADYLSVVMERKITSIGYEVIEEDGELPILRIHSQIAGRLMPQVAGRRLESQRGGRGVLLGGLPGIPPADVVILGAGSAGTYAARSFHGVGARVHVLDRNLERLEKIDRYFRGHVVTAVSSPSNVEKFCAFADVVIGAVLLKGAVAPVVVKRDTVRKMRPGSVIIDLSIDQGGCVETSKLTPGDDFVFEVDGVIHYCPPNTLAMVARASTHALTQSAMPYLKTICMNGTTGALRSSAALRRGTYSYAGEPTRDGVAAALGTERSDVEALLEG